VNGLNALLATVSSATTAPAIVARRLRKGPTNSARGAARLVTDTITTARSDGVDGALVLCADWRYDGCEVSAAARGHDIRSLSKRARTRP
jgi:hypothetical protein